MVNKTIDYYNKHSREFHAATMSVDMSAHYGKFEKFLRPSATVLDAGCGVGRDSSYFAKKGYKVLAFDASTEMVRLSKQLLGFDVMLSTFEEFETDLLFGGIWACASLLHLDRKTLSHVLRKFASFIESDGVIYMSFKYGDKAYIKDERYFNCQNEESITTLVNATDKLEIIDLYQSTDVRDGREDEYWLNIIAKSK